MLHAWRFWVVVVVFWSVTTAARAEEQSPLEPFRPDEHTLLLYHFDEAGGSVAKDAGRFGLDGQLHHAAWTTGRFGGGLEFNGKDSYVFRQATGAIEKLRKLTVECWFQQADSAGRQFLAGKDVTFHFDLYDGRNTSLSLYNQAAKPGEPVKRQHQHLSTPLGDVRAARWHHVAATYDGSRISFFLDGVLKRRLPAEKDFVLGGASRGLWIGCYVGEDYWYSGKIDELRVSDSVRYDPEGRLAEGEAAVVFPAKKGPVKGVRTARASGSGRLEIVLRRRYGGPAAGWVSLKAPGQKARIVGRYDLPESAGRKPVAISYDVSDELVVDGRYIVGLENTPGGGYFALVGARLERRGKMVAQWSGEVLSRRTFNPPLLASLEVGGSAPRASAGRVVLLPDGIDRSDGALDVDAEPGEPASFGGQGEAEYWIHVPADTTYRFYLRYASAARRPCDVVIDGADLHPYNMCARNRTATALGRDALWEYQGTVVLTKGVHWIRVQNVLPEIFGIRLEPVAAVAKPKIPWERYSAPEGHFMGTLDRWESQCLHGAAHESKAVVEKKGDGCAIRLSSVFANTDPKELSAADGVRFVARGQWDLEPFGRVGFRWTGQGSGHVLALWAVDLKGDEKLLWRARDTSRQTQEVRAGISFEGNDVFDPGHVVALAWELDEASSHAEVVSTAVAMIEDPVFERRDALEGAIEVARTEKPRTTGRGAPLVAPAFEAWAKPVVPEEHPLWAKAEPKPVSRKTLGYGMHMTGSRDISASSLDDFHKHYQFGDICWPAIGICPQRKLLASQEAYQAAMSEFERRLLAVRERGLFLFDVWGYVPFDKDYPCTVAPEHREALLRIFGDRFLGFDNGEQDGRYIGSYADKGRHTNRKEGWDDFVRWDEHVCGDNQNYMDATGSLNFSHYYGQRNCRMLGLETAQGLPSDTMMFAFLRGAGRQYGRLTYQASSIWNRFGYNMYDARQTNGGEGYGLGPSKGCSRSLHKRLFFAGYLGGQSIFGTETSQFTADRLDNGAPELSPLGRQHLELGRFAARHTDRGVPYTPVAFMLDFYNGWNPPRHLYRGDKYKIWGKLPYEKGDYQIDGMFRMVWPGYEDGSYLRNERGFLTPTPYGDIFDVITNVCHPEVLKQYAAVMLLGEVEMTPETVQRLSDYVRGGGDLVLDARHAEKLPIELTGVRVAGQARGTQSRELCSGQVAAEPAYQYRVLECQGAEPLVTSEHGHPLVSVHTGGRGRVITGAVDFWMSERLKYRHPELVNMEPPYRLLSGVRKVLGRYFDSFNLVSVRPAGLGVMSTVFDGDPKHLRVGLLNNDLFADWHGEVEIRRGAVVSVRELWHERRLPASERLEVTIPAGDVAILDVWLK